MSATSANALTSDRRVQAGGARPRVYAIETGGSIGQEKARIVLMLAPAVSRTPDDVQRMLLAN